MLIPVLYAREQDEVEHVLEGNLALPTSQQPGPLFCFGQNIVDKGDIQVFAWVSCIKGRTGNFREVLPNVLYGITDDLSLFTGMPIDSASRLNNFHPHALEDLFVQFEYAFYNKDTPTAANQATFVTNITIPTRASRSNFSNSLSSRPSFFLGATVNHMSRDWYAFLSPGATLTTSSNSSNRFLYQAGFGKNVYYIPSKLIVTLLGEFFGTHSGQNRQSDFRFSNLTQGNNIYAGPVLWISTQHFIFSTGIAMPLLVQSPNLTRKSVFFVAEIGWKFN